MEETFNDKKELEWLNGLPFEEHEDYSRKHRIMMAQTYWPFMQHFHRLFTILVDAIDAANYIKKDGWTYHNLAQWTLLSKNVRFIDSAYQKLLDGYYEESFVLGRVAFEAFCRIVWLHRYPNKDVGVIFRSTKDKGERFNITNFLTQDLEVDWLSYPLFSMFVHGNQPDILKIIDQVAHGTTPKILVYSGKQDKKMIEGLAPTLSFLLYVFYECFNHYVLTLDKTHGVEIKGLQRIMTLQKTLLKKNPKAYWQKVATDIERIFQS